MIPVLTAEDVRRQDAEAAGRGIPVERLMENAGWAVARAAGRMLGGTYGRRISVVCGKGNNGGDGLVAARLLMQRGAAVTVGLVFDEDASNPLVSAQLRRFDGVVVDAAGVSRTTARADLVIDAVFGVGLTRAPDEKAARAIDWMADAASRGTPVLAVDVPSGVASDTGAIPGVAARADATITFGGYKPGLMFAPGRDLAGVVEIADIGTHGEATASALEPADVAAVWPLRSIRSHKRSTGTLLVVAGSDAMPGAAALVCEASVHAGSGLTILCAPPEVCRIVVARVPEVTTIPVGEGASALDALAARFDEVDAIAIGPGMTTSPAAVELVRTVLERAHQPVVVDADAITACAGALDVLRARKGRATVLTPHAGELARIAASDAAMLERDRLPAAIDVATDTSAVVAFKGPGTVVTDGDVSFVNPTGGSALAQGGTGDALTGIVGSVIAQRWATDGASSTAVATLLTAAAVWVHGRAADRLAARMAPHPANATALIAELGPTVHEVFAS